MVASVSGLPGSSALRARISGILLGTPAQYRLVKHRNPSLASDNKIGDTTQNRPTGGQPRTPGA